MRTKKIKIRRSRRGTGTTTSKINLHHSKNWNEVLHTELSSSLNIGTIRETSPILIYKPYIFLAQLAHLHISQTAYASSKSLHQLDTQFRFVFPSAGLLPPSCCLYSSLWPSFSLASPTSLASCVLWDNVLCHLLESNIDTELGKKPFIFENKTQNQRFNVIGYAGSGNTSIIRYHYQHVLPHVLP